MLVGASTYTGVTGVGVYVAHACVCVCVYGCVLMCHLCLHMCTSGVDYMYYCARVIVLQKLDMWCWCLNGHAVLIYTYKQKTPLIPSSHPRQHLAVTRLIKAMSIMPLLLILVSSVDS